MEAAYPALTGEEMGLSGDSGAGGKAGMHATELLRRHGQSPSTAGHGLLVGMAAGCVAPCAGGIAVGAGDAAAARAGGDGKGRGGVAVAGAPLHAAVLPRG
eukprot:320493-Pelagomonas_calceolata.AAC.1